MLLIVSLCCVMAFDRVYCVQLPQIAEKTKILFSVLSIAIVLTETGKTAMTTSGKSDAVDAFERKYGYVFFAAVTVHTDTRTHKTHILALTDTRTHTFSHNCARKR